MELTMKEQWKADIQDYESEISSLEWDLDTLKQKVKDKEKKISRYKSLIEDRKALIKNNYGEDFYSAEDIKNMSDEEWEDKRDDIVSNS